MSNAETLPEFTTRFVNLADPRLGAKATFATDDFFAPKERMLDPNPPVFIPGKYDDNGKWMDGWESRRKRTVGHDWCVVRLGVPGRLYGVEIDTRHFTGNFPPAASLEAVWSPDGDPGDDAAWTEVLPAVPLRGDSRAFHALTPGAAFTHVRLHIWPDGGVARLRVYGAPAVDRDRLPGEIDLAAAQYGGRAVAWNDAHYGAPHNLLMPGRGVNMGDGWETRRRREPGNDWCILALGVPGTVRTVVIDTAHFKGNFPDRASILGARVDGGTDRSLITQSMFWPELLPPQKLSMDTIHTFAAEVLDLGVITHVRLNLHPDGGVSRLRLIGQVDRGDG